MAQSHAQRRALKQRIYLSAAGVGSPVTLHTGQFASLEQEIKLSSYTVAAALLRTLRTQAERHPELLPPELLPAPIATMGRKLIAAERKASALRALIVRLQREKAAERDALQIQPAD